MDKFRIALGLTSILRPTRLAAVALGMLLIPALVEFARLSLEVSPTLAED